MDELYMGRCLELARKGAGATAPNPMVGCVIVHGDTIIGEGYHRGFGQAHAEVNAIAAVRDHNLLRNSTLYVSLEPCSHYGKTPPCASLIVDKRLKKVVVGTKDPNPLVAGNGIRQLEENGINVSSGILEKECLELNAPFFTFHTRKRPWVMLKWARTEDGFIDRVREAGAPVGVNWITGNEARVRVHKWRSEVQAILVGTRTAIMDDPELTVRDWKGGNPLRLVIDREGILPEGLKLFNDKAETLVFTSKPGVDREGLTYITIPPASESGETDYIPFILEHLYGMEIQSLMVEGGSRLLNSFIKNGLWDEARVFTGRKSFGTGVPVPELDLKAREQLSVGEDMLEIFRKI